MNLKSLAGAAAIALLSLATHAASTSPVQVSGPSFSDIELGSFTIANTSNVVGSLGFAPYVLIAPGFQIALPSVSFNAVSVYNPTLTFYANGTLTGNDFGFSDLNAGTYSLRSSGSITGSNFIGAQYSAFSISPVPEPSTYAMVLLGLLAMAAIRRRQQ